MILQQEHIDAAIENAHQGLTDDIFNFVSTVTPMVNVDLLVTDQDKRLLLAWRKDEKNNGWHIPGGIVRFKETFVERIHKTAIGELGADVIFDPNPLKISEIFMPYNRRGHFISFLYSCHMYNDYVIDNHGLNEHDNGYLKWHTSVPTLVQGQKEYEGYLKKMFLQR